MEEFLTISKTAKLVGTTSETLRHYDRIGLVKPSKLDEWTNYRYYTSQDIVRLNTIKALQFMGMSLKDIKQILNSQDFFEIVNLLDEALISADKKINELNLAKSKIERAKNFYASKIGGEDKSEAVFVQEIEKRTILISNTLTQANIDSLFDYHRHFYLQLGKEKANDFLFEDRAGIYSDELGSHLFAICIKFSEDENLICLPKGKYLCANCTEKDRTSVRDKLLNIVKEQYQQTPKFVVEMINLTGILKWNYQIQIHLENI